MPEWEEKNLVLVKQTFVGPLDVLDVLVRLCAVSDVSCVLRREHQPLAESHQMVVVLSFSISSSRTA